LPCGRSSSTELGDRIATERLGPVAFRGKALPVEVFAVPCGAPAADPAGA
jgi:class 3 adenylate cyclase